jgi:acetyl-CoA acetyltransferase
MGFCRPGEAPRLLKEGYFDINGKLPTNTDGGLVGCGHPLGATGARQIAEVVTQLREAAGPRQVKGARIGLTHSSGAGPNAVFTILKRA